MLVQLLPAPAMPFLTRSSSFVQAWHIASYVQIVDRSTGTMQQDRLPC